VGLRRSFKPTNIVTEGNFPSATGWSATNSTLSANNNTLSDTCNGTGTYGTCNQITTTAVASGKKVYIKALIKVTNVSCGNIRLQITGSTGGVTVTLKDISSPVNGTQYSLSGIVTFNETYSGNVRVTGTHVYADAATANGKVMEVQEVMGIDISTLPAEIQAMSDANIKAFCDTIPWFDGTMSGGVMGGIGGLK
jgi:hypothetical protein